jgi:translocation and assembly module TamB
MPFGKGRRKWLLGIGIFLLVVALLWCSMTIWFPWVLGPIARRAGLKYASYQRTSFGRFELRDVTLTNNTVHLYVDRVQSLLPSIWAWRLLIGDRSHIPEFVSARRFSCELVPNANSKPAKSPHAQLQEVKTILSQLSRWLPSAEVRDGMVRSGNVEAEIVRATWNLGTLDGVMTLAKSPLEKPVSVNLRNGNPLNVTVASEALNLSSSFVISTNSSGFDVENTSFWHSNRFELKAHFGTRSLLPETATLQASGISIPAAMIKLPNYADLTATANAHWRGGTFDIQLTAKANPAANETNWPPAELDVQVSGDTNRATVEKLELRSPFLQASLSNRLEIGFIAPFIRTPAQLTVTGDLSRQHWADVKGTIIGTAEIGPGTDKLPRGQLRLSGARIGNASLKASSVEISADLQWPKVERISAVARFADGSEAKAQGEYDVDKKTIAGGHAEFTGALAGQWLPAGYSYQTLTFQADFQGPIEAIKHTGKLELSNPTVPQLKLAALKLEWNGEARELQHFLVEASGTNAVITTEGNLKLGTNAATELGLTRLSLFTNSHPALELAAPVEMTYSRADVTNGWQLGVTPLHLRGPGGELSLEAEIQWPERGEVTCSLRHISLGLLSAITSRPLPQLEISDADASGSWSNGPVKLRVVASATGKAQPGSGRPPTQSSDSVAPTGPAELLSTPLTAKLDLVGDAQGLVLSNLVVMSPTSSVLVAHGEVPLAIVPGNATNLLEIRLDQPLDLTASIRPEAFFWETVADLAGIDLVEPNVDLKLNGTWNSPQGHILALARQIQLKHSTLTNLALSDLRFELQLERNEARLVQGQVFVQGQRVGLTGQLPLNQDSWNRLRKKQLPDWDKATARLAIDDAKLAAFVPLFPEVLAPQGELTVDLRLLPGADLDGSLTLRHARTRPLGNTAPIRDINATMRFSNRVLALENATASLSGAGVELAGRADLRGTNWMSSGLPPFALTLRGTNVPLARTPEYIIRSDLDLAIVKTNEATPLVTGKAHLRDSFYLSDISALVPNKVSASAGRPPFFSIDNPSVADWRLGVNVEGVRWLKLRTSLFNGEVSANLHLEGTLRDPIALGGLKVDSGLVRFPFANLQMQQGLVTLTSQDPYRPQLLVRAASKQFGYDIRMEVSGSTDAPIIQFTSNPALSSEQILLMITAGQLPQGSFTLTPQQRAQTVALFLGRDLLSKLGLGDQSQERLTISSGEEISVQNRPTYHVEYKLTPRWSLTGEYDRFGDFNAGFKWRVYSK